jgi:hypothetical protein
LNGICSFRQSIKAKALNYESRSPQADVASHEPAVGEGQEGWWRNQQEKPRRETKERNQGTARAFSSFPETSGNSQDNIVLSVQYPTVPSWGARVEIA